MKIVNFGKIILFCVVACAVSCGTAIAGSVVNVEASEFFIPSGFDDNDQIELMISGYFPSSCYSSEEPEAKIDYQNYKITVYPRATKQDGICMTVLVPYLETLKLKTLPKGTYQVVSYDNKVKRTLSVAEAGLRNLPDDHMYAPIDSAFTMYYSSTNKRYAILNGRFTNTCMEWAEIRLIHKTANVLEILPIVEMQDRDDCKDIEFHFKGVKVELPKLTKQQYLLHVRTANGAALNTMFFAE